MVGLLTRSSSAIRPWRSICWMLELSASEGAIVLQAEGVLTDGATPQSVRLHFDASSEGGRYVDRDDDPASFTRNELVSLAAAGEFTGTFTGRAGRNVDVDNPQPAIWTLGGMAAQSGRQQFPTLSAADRTMTFSARNIEEGANVVVDGRRVAGSVSCQNGALPLCSFVSPVEVQLESIPGPDGIHFLQVQNPDGLFSNDFIFHTVPEPGRAVLGLAALLTIASLRIRQVKNGLGLPPRR